jgi:hypothetical protein
VLDPSWNASTLIQEPLLEKILKRDLRYLLVFLAPSLPPAKHMDEIEDLATHFLISKKDFRSLRNSLLKTGAWRLSEDGQLSVRKGHLDLGELSTHEFTNMCLGMLTHLSETGPCNYENLFLVTTAELKRAFYMDVNRALKNLMEKSRDADGDHLLGWAHMGIDFGNLEEGLITKMTPFGKEKPE